MTAAISATDYTPRVWPACLHCYNNGRLVGCWVDCTDAEGVTLAMIHESTGGPYSGCEEIWCLDIDCVPVRHEMDLREAAEWGRVSTEAGPEQWPAVCAWVESGSHVTEADTDIPSLSEFEERYQGHWDSFDEYADHWAEETDLMARWPDLARQYFDWAAWRRDLKFDFTVMSAPASEGYGVYVFSNL